MYIVHAILFNVINSSIMNNFTSIQELSRTPENSQGQQNVFQESLTWPVLIANSRKVLDPQRRLAMLPADEVFEYCVVADATFHLRTNLMRTT